MERLSIQAKLENLEKMFSFIREASLRHGFDSEHVNKIQLASEEALVNVISYAYPQGSGDLEIIISNKETCMEIEISDSGIPFDPLSLPEPDILAPIEERKVGGLGIFMIRKIMDEVRYKRDKERNILTLVKTKIPKCCETVKREKVVEECGSCFRWPIAFMKQELFKKGEVIFKAQDTADRMFYIKKGAIRLVEINKIIKDGDVIGEMGIFSPFKKRIASAVCVEDVESYTMGRDEVIKLFGQDPGLAIELIQMSIKRFIENLKAETEARERIESELRIAQEIQASMLPSVFPERKEFEIFAMMDPAKEVGGDFYDFFFVDDRRLCFVIGDVSGKGVPAALFMAISKTLIKNEAKRGLPTDEILNRVNNIIAPDNQTCQFVTVFCVILDIDTGELKFCNAGHNPPLVCDHSGCFDFVSVLSGFVMGVMENTKCEQRELKLKPGDLIFLYTDGVTEAMNQTHQMFSEARLKDHLTKFKGQGIKDIIGNIREEIRVFAEGAPQSDDITMLAVRYTGK
ncbi:MAG: SpoIIE family protein phosphatase [Candidatus Omnitrophota bacterium]|jgi:serine phosphatase RsbU (regulator of sigma subunit)/anti-sigma regulatory factor (Ser/Thr protein kinase)